MQASMPCIHNALTICRAGRIRILTLPFESGGAQVLSYEFMHSLSMTETMQLMLEAIASPDFTLGNKNGLMLYATNLNQLFCAICWDRLLKT